MSCAAVMVYVDADGTPERRVRLSATLADKFNATLIGLSAIAIRPPMMVKGFAMDRATEAEVAALSTKLADKGSWFHNIARAEHRKLEWRPVFDFPGNAVAREARSADLIVIGQMSGPGDTYSSLEPGDAVLRIGRAALIVPDSATSLRAQRVVIGWKDCREARRAVQDALPFLGDATRVTITEICRSGEEEAARNHLDDVALYLTRHRINAGPKVIIQQEGSGAAQLIKLAEDEGADLIVTGAYGHGRLGEWIFGGMTNDLLATSPICCFMSN